MAQALNPVERLEQLRTRAAARGLRMTPQRQVLLQVLASLRHHPTADELYRRVVQRLPSVSPATVYRNLQTLVQSGVISVLERAGSAVRYDPNPDEHHHFVCRRCRRLFDVYLTDVAVAVNFRRSGIPGARIDVVRVELAGLCPRCRLASKRRPAARPEDTRRD